MHVELDRHYNNNNNKVILVRVALNAIICVPTWAWWNR